MDTITGTIGLGTMMGGFDTARAKAFTVDSLVSLGNVWLSYATK